MLEEYEPEALVAMTTKNSFPPPVTHEFCLCVIYKIFSTFLVNHDQIFVKNIIV